ncbi:MAG: Asp/Glu racemase [Propionibacteriales bacterium]|nr:Asp/Glu racemase [Propionibacteriales bacterium]
MSQSKPLVAMIHSNFRAASAADEVFAEVIPEAALWNILDDQLVRAVRSVGELTSPLSQRMLRLVDHALTEGADVVQFTCATYGPVADIARSFSDRPVYTSDQALWEHLLANGTTRVGILAAHPTALLAAIEQLEWHAVNAGKAVDIETLLGEEALDARDRTDALTQSLVRAATGTRAEVVVLAQYSLSPLAAVLSERLGLPVYSGVRPAAEWIRDDLAVGNIREADVTPLVPRSSSRRGYTTA